MRLRNNSKRTIVLGGNARIVPGGEMILAADAQHLAASALVKAYLSDKTLSVVGAGKVRMTADRKVKAEADAA